MNLPGIIIVLIVLISIPVGVLAGSMEGRLAYRKGDYATALLEFGAGPVGTYFQALMYLHGEGVSRDEVRGLKLLRSSADEGYSAAQYLLGQRYLYGQGVPKDKGLAQSYLRSASDDGDYRAVVLLKILKKVSRGEKKDGEDIVVAVKRKAKSNMPDAQYTLAFMYLVGDGVPKNGVEEVRWYRVASLKNARAAFMLSLMYHYGEGVPRDPVEAVRLMRIPAERGDFRAQYYLGTFCYQGVGTQVDKPAAAAWFRLSAEGNYDEAQLAYGMLLLSGDGVAQDKGLAIEWLSKAAKQNNSRAKEIISELLMYRGQPNVKPLAGDTAAGAEFSRQTESQLRLEGKGIILDQGQYGLKFSLPNLNDAYAPNFQMPSHSIWEKMQGGTFEIIFRQSK
jgi:TPR repeat protein